MVCDLDLLAAGFHREIIFFVLIMFDNIFQFFLQPFRAVLTVSNTPIAMRLQGACTVKELCMSEFSLIFLN